MKIHTITTHQEIITEDCTLLDYGEINHVDIRIMSGVHCTYICIPKSGQYMRNISLESHAIFNGNSIIVESGEVCICTEAIGQNVDSELRILAIAYNNASISVEGVAKVAKPFEDIYMRVDQTNILIGENISIRGIPKLDIATNSITGGHSCKVHKLSGDTLFYLQSRGLTTDKAQGLLLESEIKRHLPGITGELYESIYGIIIGKYLGK